MLIRHALIGFTALGAMLAGLAYLSPRPVPIDPAIANIAFVIALLSGLAYVGLRLSR